MAKRQPNRSVIEMEKGSEEIVDNVLALYPNLPAANLVERADEMASPEFLDDLNRTLRAKHWISGFRARRARDRRAQWETEWLSPEMRASVTMLPRNVPISKKEKVPLAQIRYADTGRALQFLVNEDSHRHLNKGKIQALKKLRKDWPRGERGRPLRCTLPEADRMRARQAGLIE